MHNSVSTSSNAVHLIYPHTEEDGADLAKGKAEDRTQRVRAVQVTLHASDWKGCCNC